MDNLLNHVLYINLDHRDDRREYVIKELQKIGIKEPERFPAVKMVLFLKVLVMNLLELLYSRLCC